MFANFVDRKRRLGPRDETNLVVNVEWGAEVG
jgi:hypothetical protein